MKSLYFQTVGIECKFYENQQLEYRLYSWGRSVFEKLFPQSARPPRGIICPKSVVVARYGAFIVTYIISANCDAHLAESFFQTRSKAFQIAIFLFTLYFVCDMMFQSGLYNCR